MSGGSLSSSVAESVQRQIGHATAVAAEAVTSGAWAYPLLGIPYLLSHPSLVRPILPALFKGVVLSIAVLVALFFFAYLPQVAVLAFVSGPLAFVAAVPLVLGEAYVVINFLARSFLFDTVGTDLFDAVLVQKGHLTLVEKGRQVTGSGAAPQRLGRLITKPLSRFNVDNVVRYILTLPLNLIPVVGTAFFLIFNGYKSGPSYHARYFQLKGYDKSRRAAATARRRGAYTGFGSMAAILNLVPVVSVLFNCTTSVGAALWAADLESKGSSEGAKKDAKDVEVTIPRPGGEL
ncbi:hypothetical protein EHS25_005502 [Saitozyma podzolica]|uniref:Outer spore wall protein RRT8 n=1 Tax=Saitozyma podzolica TaxID=1890683 RepID=A0A427XYL3_9TREE|nr:hypothetical protein EHS25_005502 [Saitozyma podzolica]